MAKLIHLGRERKRAARAQQARQAQSNRAKFGRTRAERTRDEQQTARTEAMLDQQRLSEKDEA